MYVCMFYESVCMDVYLYMHGFKFDLKQKEYLYVCVCMYVRMRVCMYVCVCVLCRSRRKRRSHHNIQRTQRKRMAKKILQFASLLMLFQKFRRMHCMSYACMMYVYIHVFCYCYHIIIDHISNISMCVASKHSQI